jgi:hypothetical protein
VSGFPGEESVKRQRCEVYIEHAEPIMKNT